MLQDANLNVVGLCRSGAPAGAVEMVRQDVYSPYGETIATDLFDQTAPDNRVGFQGMFFDRFAANAADPQVTPGGDGLYRTANRSYHPALGRWLQRDPNATAQPIVEALVYNGRTNSFTGAMFDVEAHHGDGMNPYEFVRSNPTNSGDPLGLFSLIETVETASLSLYLRGEMFAAAHPLAIRFVGGLLAAIDIYAFIQYEEVRAITISQPNLGGIISGQLRALQLGIRELVKTGGSIRAFATASEETVALAARANAVMRAQYASEAGLKIVRISRSRWPEAAAHIADAQAAGHPSVLTIDRIGANTRRGMALKGIPKVSGKQLDEYPPAMFLEGGIGASIRAIIASDNQGVGGYLRQELGRLADGAKVRLEVVP
jgi:filamentous hemagglutinin